jgi:hypothetical protein
MRLHLLWFLVLLLGTGLACAQDAAPRQVTHRVFAPGTRTPVPEARVYASYCWETKAVLAEATADREGQVVWSSLPPVRVIVWGPKVAPGVIEPTVTDTRDPLPAPEADSRTVFVSISLPDLDIPGKQIITLLTRENGKSQLGHATDAFGSLDQPKRHTISLHTPSGTPVSVFAVANTAPCRWMRLETYYVPYLPTRLKGATCPLTWQTGITVRGRFVAPNNLAIHGFSRAIAVPVDVPSLPTEYQYQAYMNQPLAANMLHLSVKRGGAFTLSVPLPGTYRFLIDLFDAAMPPLTVTVTHDAEGQVVNLPEPVITAPANAELIWYRKGAPFTPHRMRVVGRPGQIVPVFGPIDHLLVCWYYLDRETMVLWNALDLQPQRTLKLMRLNLQLPGNVGMAKRCLFPLMPYVPPGYAYSHTNSFFKELGDLQLKDVGQTESLVSVWPVTTLLGYYDGTDHSYRLLGAITARDNDTVRIPALPSFNELSFAPKTIPVALRFATTDNDDALRKIGAKQVLLVKHPSGDEALVSNNSLSFTAPSWHQMRESDRMLQLNWLGVGEITYTHPLSITPTAERTMQLPAWQPGSVISGEVQNADGTPFARGTIHLLQGRDRFVPSVQREAYTFGGAGRELELVTDDQGRFTARGCYDGLIKIIAYRTGTSSPIGAWIKKIENHRATVQLRIPTQQGSVTFFDCDNGIHGAAWWIPDTQGYPWPLCMEINTLYENFVRRSSGYLWIFDGLIGRSYYLRSIPGQKILPATAQPHAGLALYFPLNTNFLPGAVRLRHYREPMEVVFPRPRWQPASLLNASVAQIDAVPPGRYRLTVDTTAGQVIEEIEVEEYGTDIFLPLPPNLR